VLQTLPVAGGRAGQQKLDERAVAMLLAGGGVVSHVHVATEDGLGYDNEMEVTEANMPPGTVDRPALNADHVAKRPDERPASLQPAELQVAVLVGGDVIAVPSKFCVVPVAAQKLEAGAKAADPPVSATFAPSRTFQLPAKVMVLGVPEACTSPAVTCPKKLTVIAPVPALTKRVLARNVWASAEAAADSVTIDGTVPVHCKVPAIPEDRPGVYVPEFWKNRVAAVSIVNESGDRFAPVCRVRVPPLMVHCVTVTAEASVTARPLPMMAVSPAVGTPAGVHVPAVAWHTSTPADKQTSRQADKQTSRQAHSDRARGHKHRKEIFRSVIRTA
jgi:hypothetical protein